MRAEAVGVLCGALGVLALGIGILQARQRMHSARRVRRKTQAIQAAMPDGWSFWFFRGFSDLTPAAHLLIAAAGLAAWAGLGLGLLSLGVRLAR